MAQPLLISPVTLRSVTLRNRIVISPLCQYSAAEGMANDWHFAHLARFALGGAGAVFVEATAVNRDGRITHGDMGLWSDAHVAPLRRIADFVRSQGAAPAIQLAHAGRKASMQRPWDGIDGGWTLDDTVTLARELKARDVDVVDCSSGGIAGSATAARIARHPGFQVPFAERIKREAGIKTMAVGLILEPEQAEAILQNGQADLIAIGRQALYDPNWPLHAERALLRDAADFEHWPVQAGAWLERRERSLRALQAEPARKQS